MKQIDRIPFGDIAKNFLGQSLEGGIEVATDAVQQLQEMENGGAMAMSQFLHGVNFHWKELGYTDDNFENWVVGSIGYNRAVIQRKVCVWDWLTGDWIPREYLETIEKNFSARMLSKAYKVSLRHSKNKHVGNYDFILSGNEIESGDWIALSECVDDAMLITVIDNITKREPNANRVSFDIDDNGSIWFNRGKKDRVVVGSLSVLDRSPLIMDGVAEAVERLTK